MNCSDSRYLRPLYLSGELDNGSTAQMERHLAECLRCRREVEEEQALDKALKHALLREPVHAAALRSRVRHLMHPERGDRLFLMRHPMQAALAIAAMLLMAITLVVAHRDNLRYEEASADHVNEVVRAAPKSWQTEDGSIAQLVAQRLAVPAAVLQLTIPSYRLLRGKECSIASNRYVHLVYGDGKQELSMYLLEGDGHGLLRRVSTRLTPPYRSRTKDGYNITEGDADGRRILLVSTLSATEEQAIVRHVLQTMS